MSCPKCDGPVHEGECMNCGAQIPEWAEKLLKRIENLEVIVAGIPILLEGVRFTEVDISSGDDFPQ